MVRFERSRQITQIAEYIDPRQYAREGHSTADALIYLLQSIHEATDTGECAARIDIFCLDSSKGFDLIDHNILLKELWSFNIDPVLVNWIFLIDRREAVRIENFLSDWKGGIPRGDKTWCYPV